MNNYKIKVNDEDENKEVISLFVQLGYVDSKSTRFGLVYTIGKKIGCDRLTHWDYYTTQGCQELTLPQLRDLVVLHRNDVNDANYIYRLTPFYCMHGSRFYVFEEGKWRNFVGDLNSIVDELKPIQQEQGLISGAEKTIKVNGLDFIIEGKDALRSALDGNDIQLSLDPWEVNSWSDFNPTEDEASTKVFFTGLSSDGQKVFFRIKPQTIKLELEIPEPFEPNAGEEYFYLAHTNTGYDSDIYESTNIDECQIQFGAWRTEEEIKQVVEAWRGGIKG